MPRDLILGTAGHIDHGKTALVKALTGIDCDRLPEEKARGITIDIGFAHFELAEFRLGVVDVPGHERFIKNMLAGANGVDLALLVVSAGESIRAQTREHLELLQLLGVKHGVVAITKADAVDKASLEIVEMEVREYLRGTFLESAIVLPTSARSGEGIEALKSTLLAQCRNLAGERGVSALPFRLPIDRAFVIQGHGTIVTGSVLTGRAAVGDELEWHRGDGTRERVRARGLNNHDHDVPEVHQGQRAAINLAGVEHERVRRGQELAEPGYLVPSKVLTIGLSVLAGPHRPIKHRLPVRLHIGTAEIMATVALLDCDLVNPGQSALAQLFLEEYATATWDQPFILRDSSAEHTLGGGRVLQPVAAKLRRRHLEWLEKLEQLQSTAPDGRAEAVAWLAGFDEFNPADLPRSAGIPACHIPGMVNRLKLDGVLLELPTASRPRLLHLARLEELEQHILSAVAEWHTEAPLLTNLDRQKVLARLDFIEDKELLQAIANRLLAGGKLVGDGHRIAAADFKPKLSLNQRKLKDRIVSAHLAAGLQPPDPASFAPQAAGNAAALKEIYEVAAAEGLLVKLNPDFYLHGTVEAEMRRKVEERLRTGPGATVAELRDLLGTTRKYAIPFCEYLDRIGLTKRQGDVRILGGSE